MHAGAQPDVVPAGDGYAEMTVMPPVRYSTAEYAECSDIGLSKKPQVGSKPQEGTQPRAGEQPKAAPRKNKPTSLKRPPPATANQPNDFPIYTAPLSKEERGRAVAARPAGAPPQAPGSAPAAASAQPNAPSKPPRINQGVVARSKSQIEQKLGADQRQSEIEWKPNELYASSSAGPPPPSASAQTQAHANLAR